MYSVKDGRIRKLWWDKLSKELGLNTENLQQQTCLNYLNKCQKSSIFKYTMKFRCNLHNTNHFILSSQETQFKSSSKIYA